MKNNKFYLFGFFLIFVVAIAMQAYKLSELSPKIGFNSVFIIMSFPIAATVLFIYTAVVYYLFKKSDVLYRKDITKKTGISIPLVMGLTILISICMYFIFFRILR